MDYFTFRNLKGIQDSVIIQIKILMDAPQHIWSNIESKNLLFATQLYLVAQHINYSLLFEVGNDDLSNKYPIVSKQWDIITQFKNVITSECNHILQSLDVQPEVGALLHLSVIDCSVKEIIFSERCKLFGRTCVIKWDLIHRSVRHADIYAQSCH